MTEPRQPKTTDEHYKLAANYMNIAAGGSLVGAASTIPLALFTAKLDLTIALQLSAALVLGSLVIHGVGQLFLRQATS